MEIGQDFLTYGTVYFKNKYFHNEEQKVTVCFRFNLDPGDDHTDPEIKESLKLAGLPDLAYDLSQVSS